jgi:hypothetical protein
VGLVVVVVVVGVEVLVVVVAVVVVGVVVEVVAVGVVVVVVRVEEEAVVATLVLAVAPFDPLSDAITARAMPSPITTATSSAMANFIPVLIPPRGGSPAPYPWPPPQSSGGICLVGSSCIGGRV